MRLPRDPVLLVVDACAGSGAAQGGPAAIAALLKIWRGHGLPVAHARPDPDLAPPPAALAPRGGETCFARMAADAFADGRLDAALTRLGVTTLVLCGGAADAGLEAAARGALERGYRVFLVAEACAAPPDPALVQAGARIATLAVTREAAARSAGLRLLARRPRR